MENKTLLREDMLWLTNHQGTIESGARSAGVADRLLMHCKNILNRMILSLKGSSAGDPKPHDPAAAIIMQIPDPEVRTMVKELHYLTPTSLKTMRQACEQCFFLPEDCPYVDYSIPDVNKAVKRMGSHPLLSANPERVINELAKVNRELAGHLQEHFESLEA